METAIWLCIFLAGLRNAAAVNGKVEYWWTDSTTTEPETTTVPSTSEPITTVGPTGIFTISKSTTSATPSPPSPKWTCSCNNRKIWLDIYFLTDASSIMERHRMDNAVAFILSILHQMTVGRDTENMMKTRAGFISFDAHRPHLLYNLSHWESTSQLINDLKVHYYGGSGGNIRAAIRLAANGFKSPQHRPDVQKVMVIIASSEHGYSFTEAEHEAQKFKANGGSIITIEYSPSTCRKTSRLENLASKASYAFSNCRRPLKAQNIRNAFCDVNCFCPKYTKPYGDAIYGCYRAVTMPAIQSLAERNCRQYNAVLPKITSDDTAQFLTNLMPWRTTFWIGLKREHGVFRWSDGTRLERWDYNDWAPGYPKPYGGDCVSMKPACPTCHWSEWYNVDCDEDLDYVCDTKPCDTDHYCGIKQDQKEITTPKTTPDRWRSSSTTPWTTETTTEVESTTMELTSPEPWWRTTSTQTATETSTTPTTQHWWTTSESTEEWTTETITEVEATTIGTIESTYQNRGGAKSMQASTETPTTTKNSTEEPL